MITFTLNGLEGSWRLGVRSGTDDEWHRARDAGIFSRSRRVVAADCDPQGRL